MSTTTSTYIVMTYNTAQIKVQLHAHTRDIELVAGHHDFLVWVWRHAEEEDVAPFKDNKDVFLLTVFPVKEPSVED